MARSLTLVALLVCMASMLLVSTSEAACPSAICRSIKCATPAPECQTDAQTMAANHYRLAAHGTSCGCCPLCVRLLQEGESCTVVQLRSTLAAYCDDSLRCEETIGKCVPK